MLQCETAMAGAALLRLRLLYRMLRAGEVLALVAFVSWASWYVPSAVAAVVRLAGSLLVNARFVFFLGNAIVLLLFALSRHEHDLSPGSSSSSSSNNNNNNVDEQQPAPSTATTPTTTALPSSIMGGSAAAAASFATPVAPSAMEEALPLREAEPQPQAAAKVLFEDKQQSVVLRSVNKARAPRRSRSEKMGPRRAASPELRRCESENGRRRRSSVTARDAEACWGREDADEFRRTVEAFIARQTRFHREESMSMTMAFSGALAVVE